jgi:hypothetical protein
VCACVCAYLHPTEPQETANDPAGHTVHALLIGAPAKLPGIQSWQSEEEGEEAKVPAGQMEQSCAGEAGHEALRDPKSLRWRAALAVSFVNMSCGVERVGEGGEGGGGFGRVGRESKGVALFALWAQRLSLDRTEQCHI